MELDEHEEQEEEIEMHPQMEAAVLRLGNSGVKYKECLKNHAVGIGGHALDGCCEFMAAGEEGTLDALKCAACSCHRNFHRKENEGKGLHHNRHIFPPLPSSSHHHHHHPSNSAPHFSAYSYRSHHHQHPSGYLQVTPPPRPLALPSTSRDDEGMSNPSSSGGGGGGGGGGANKKRFRSKFSQEQKDRMLAFAEKVGWRILKQDEAAVQQFCAESNVRRHVLKVWMHNNKHTLGKKT